MITAIADELSEGKRTAVEATTPETAKKPKLAEFDPTFGQSLKCEEKKQIEKQSEQPDDDSEENSAENSAEDEASEESEGSEDEAEDGNPDVLDGLISLFKEKNGRDPTENEIKMWIETLKEASGDLGANLEGCADENDESKEGSKSDKESSAKE